MKLPNIGFSGTVGITGTREGCTEGQMDVLVGFLLLFRTLRHGSCVGVDEEAHSVFEEVINDGRDHFIVIHPPKNKSFLFRPKTRGISARISSAVPKEYHARNRDIVDLSDVVVACPKQKLPKKKWKTAKGGTWYTINYAIENRAVLVIVWPDGSTKIIDPRTD